MRTLIFTFSDEFTRELAISLIPKGFEPIEMQTREEVLAYLESEEKIALFVTEVVDKGFLEAVRERNKDMHIYLLFHESLKPSDLMGLSNMGIHSLIPFAESPARVGEEIMKNAMQAHILNMERRFHVRVQPGECEKIEASIFIKGLNRFVHGNLLDISAGGAAVRLNDSIEASILDVDKTYNPLVLHITGSQVKSLARLKGKRADIAGFQFENIEKNHMLSIARYIHNNLQDKSRKIVSQLLIKNNPGK